MSKSIIIAAKFGSSRTGLSTVGYRLYDSSGSALAARITAGITERGSGTGTYSAVVVIPSSLPVEVRWDSGEVTPRIAGVFVNEQDVALLEARAAKLDRDIAEKSDILGSFFGTGAYVVTITVTDGSAVALQSARVRLTEGVNSHVAPTDVNGQVSFSLDAATYDVSITKAGYSFTPTTLAISGAASHTYQMTAIAAITPPTDLSLCRVIGYMETIDNQPAANLEIAFTLVAPNATKSERLISGRKIKAVTDSQGRLSDGANAYLDLQRNDLMTPPNTKYRVTCNALQLDREITLAAPTFDLSSLV